jgi:uncharacterized protein (DUF58 family)
MRVISRFINEKARAWALERSGEDDREVTLTTHRVYILPTRQGLAFSVLLLAMLLASLNYNNSLGLALTFMLGGLAVVAMHHCHHNLVGLTVRFRGVEPVFAGQRAEFRFALQGRGRHPRFQFQLQSDTGIGEEQWMRSAFVDVSPEDSPDALLPVPTRARGLQPVTRLGIATRYPFGLFRAWSWLHMDCRVVVYPRPATDAPVVLAGEGDSAGVHDDRGGEEDFAGLRAFRSGDSPRHIAWKAYARDEEPRTKQYAGQVLSSTWLDFDALTDPDTERRLEILTRQILEAESSAAPYGLRLPGSTIQPSLGPAHRDSCLQALALFPAAPAAARPAPPKAGRDRDAA